MMFSGAMTPNDHMPLQCFHEVSISEKARAIERWGVALTSTEIFGMRFMLYSLKNYFAEVTINVATCEILSISATVEPSVMDLYLESVDISDALASLQK